jgi:hypothetical protein
MPLAVDGRSSHRPSQSYPCCSLPAACLDCETSASVKSKLDVCHSSGACFCTRKRRVIDLSKQATVIERFIEGEDINDQHQMPMDQSTKSTALVSFNLDVKDDSTEKF